MACDVKQNMQKTNGEKIGGTTNSSMDQRAMRSFNRYQQLVGNNLGLYPSIVGFSNITEEVMQKGILDMLRSNGIDDEFIEVRVIYNTEYDKVIRTKTNPKNINAFSIYVVLKESSKLIHSSRKNKNKVKDKFDDYDPLLDKMFVNGLTAGEYKVSMATELKDKLAPFMPVKNDRPIFKAETIRYKKEYSYAYRLDYNVCMRYFFGIATEQIDYTMLDVISVNHKRSYEHGREIFNATILKAYRKPNDGKKNNNSSYERALMNHLSRTR